MILRLRYQLASSWASSGGPLNYAATLLPLLGRFAILMMNRHEPGGAGRLNGLPNVRLVLCSAQLVLVVALNDQTRVEDQSRDHLQLNFDVHKPCRSSTSSSPAVRRLLEADAVQSGQPRPRCPKSQDERQDAATFTEPVTQIWAE